MNFMSTASAESWSNSGSMFMSLKLIFMCVGESQTIYAHSITGKAFSISVHGTPTQSARIIWLQLRLNKSSLRKQQHLHNHVTLFLLLSWVQKRWLNYANKITNSKRLINLEENSIRSSKRFARKFWIRSWRRIKLERFRFSK